MKSQNEKSVETCRVR